MKKIAILTSGGDAPGMNAAIRAVTRSCLVNDIEVYGVENGYRGLYDNNIFKLDRRSVAEKLNRGGTFLGTARFPEFADDEVCQKAIDNLQEHGIDCVVTIGGNGTYLGANKLASMGMNIIGVPGTIDNDIASSIFTIGFDTAVNTVVEAIDKIRDTSSSHSRCSIIEVMGRTCGDIALHSGIAVGAEAIFTSDNEFSYEAVCDIVNEAKQNKKNHTLIVVTENICDVIDLAKHVQDNTGYETRSTILGHIQRGGTPSAFDRYIASSLGCYCTELIKDSIYNVCVGTTGSTLYYTPIESALVMPSIDKKQFYSIATSLK